MLCPMNNTANPANPCYHCCPCGMTFVLLDFAFRFPCLVGGFFPQRLGFKGGSQSMGQQGRLIRCSTSNVLWIRHISPQWKGDTQAMQHYCMFSQSILKRTIQSHHPVAGSPGQPWSNRFSERVVFFVFFFFLLKRKKKKKTDRQRSETPSMR